MSEIHGINCKCCEPKSLEAQELYNEVASLLIKDPGVGKPSREKIIEDVKEYREKLLPVGDIIELVKLTEALFSLPPGEVNYEALKLEDPEKTVQGFKVRDMIDIPGIDLTKLIDLSGINLSVFKKLKIGLSIPTIDAVLTLNFGILQLGIRFKIGLDTFSWAPDVKFPDPEAALNALKGLSYEKLVTESEGKKLDKLKSLADKQFGNNPDVLSSLKSAADERDFFEKTRSLEINLLETVDMESVARGLYEQSKEFSDLEKGSEKKLSEPEKLTAQEIVDKIDTCVDPVLTPAPYREEEIQKVHDETCRPEDTYVDAPVVDIPDVTLPNPEEELKKVQDFLKEVDDIGKSAQQCANEKIEANNKWYFLIEQKNNNEISKTYFNELTDAFERLRTISKDIIGRRDEKIQEIVTNGEALEALYDDFNSKFPQYIFYAFDTAPRATRVNSGDVNTDATGGANTITGIMGSLTNFREFLKSNSEFHLKEYDRLVEIRGRLRNELQKILDEYLGFTQTEYGADAVFELRELLLADKSKVSNLVGYFVNEREPFYSIEKTAVRSEWQIKVPQNVYGEISSFWNSTVNNAINGKTGVSEPLNNFIQLSNLPVYSQDGTYIIEPRKGVFEDGLWNPFYSAKRIDYFFTYQEQGYTKPKPVLGQDGKPVGNINKKNVTTGTGENITVDVPADSDGLDVDMEKAIYFLENLDTLLKQKVLAKIEEIKAGQTYKSYLQKIKNAAKKESSVFFFEDPATLDPLGNAIKVYTPENRFRRNSDVVNAFSDIIQEKMNALEIVEREKKECVKKGEEAIEAAARKMAGSDGTDSQNIKKNCKDKLGTDPVGNKPIDARCPGITKNCYWAEYTKVLQKVSLMPVPELDVNNLAQRLFRYYPVGLTIPIGPPPVAPTLTLPPVPQPLIVIPLPFLWKHIFTLSTPLGTIVIWIALAGPVPNPFIMLIDEKGEPTFMLTPFGPCSIPHPTVSANPLEQKSLIDIIIPEATLKINLSSPLGKLLVGDIHFDTGNPDSGKNVIGKLKEKIKSSYSQLEIPDPPSIGGNSEAIREKKKKIREAFELVPPDPAQISEAIDEVFDTVKKAVGNIKVSSIKIPKGDDKMLIPVLGPLEIIDNLLGLVDTAASAPGQIAQSVIADLMQIKTINPPKKLKELVLAEVSRPEIKKIFTEIDSEIDEIESEIRDLQNSLQSGLDDVEKVKEAIKKRVAVVKKLVKKPIEKVAREITPEKLGFVAIAPYPVPLPIPCYKNIQLPPVPPYIYAIIAIIQSAPSLIDAIPDDLIGDLISFEIDLTKSLPRAEPLFYGSLTGVLSVIPEIEIPDPDSDNMFKQTIGMVKSIITKFKVRLPKPGLPTQIIIPGSLIKSIIVEVAGIALDAIKAIIMAKLAEVVAAATSSESAKKIIAIYLVIRALFGVGLEDIKGSDIKAFIGGMLESTVYPALDVVSNLIDAANALSAPFLSIIELFQFPPKLSLPGNDGPFIEISTELIKPFVEPLLNQVLPPLFDALPLIAVLIAASFTPTRLAFTKLHPLKAREIMPAWEGISSKNIPFTMWLDLLAATAQRKALLGSTYIIPFVAVP